MSVKLKLRRIRCGLLPCSILTGDRSVTIPAQIEGKLTEADEAFDQSYEAVLKKIKEVVHEQLCQTQSKFIS